MNELLNRWRHGEVNLLQRRFRQGRGQAVKQTIASKIKILSSVGSLAAPSSSSGTATSAATSANRDGSASFGEEHDGSTSSPASRDGNGATATAAGAPELDMKKPGERDSLKAGQVTTGNGEAGKVVSLGDAGGARAGMDKEAFLRVFPDVQVRSVIWGAREKRGGTPAWAHFTQFSRPSCFILNVIRRENRFEILLYVLGRRQF